MKLNQLLKGVDAIEFKGNRQLEISSISYDSRQIKPGGLFFAIKGHKSNGANFIDEALERGAICVVSEDDFITYKTVCKIKVPDVRKACATIANNFYDRPSEKMDVTGITGTNGKTTTLHLIEQILSHVGMRCGTIGTISYNIGERTIPAVNTTPSSIMLQMLMDEMKRANTPNCVMEVSSHSIHQHRVNGIKYRQAIFTNLSGEHLDYHKDMEDYFSVKKGLFEALDQGAHAIINIDDLYGKRILDVIKCNRTTYAIKNEADIKALDIQSSIKGSAFKIKTPKGLLDIKTKLIGEYNIYNILAAVSLALSKEVEFADIKEAIENFAGAPGRLQRVASRNDIAVFVDYAHTDDALLKVLGALRCLASARIILVFGCGGDRDKSKRPRMGRIAAELADYIIVTSDNPRSEEPKNIADDIVKGFPVYFKNYKIALDRKKAIEKALGMAQDGDIVLIAGKGHEKYQVFKDVTVAFDDYAIAGEMLESIKINEKILK